MANAFKNAVSESIGTSSTDVYTAPASTTTTIIGATVANRTSGTITVDVTLTDTSSGTTVFLINDAPIPPGSSIVIVGGDQKVVLETGDRLTVVSDTASSADAIISVLEQS